MSKSNSSYTILDIRQNDGSDTQHSETKPTAAHLDVPRPPSPPASNHPSVENAFNGSDLVDSILDGLSQPAQHKSIPTFVLYDTKGLQLFDKITYLDDYYLTEAEQSILKVQADNLADRVKEGSVIIELGAGSLRKTELILQAIEKKQRHVVYYALDLDQRELEKSLSSLGDGYRYVKLMGLLGTYDQGIPWLSKRYTSQNVPKLVLWLGSSIGNQSRFESAVFLNKLQRTCLQPGDLCLVGFDRRNEPAMVAKAYDDSEGVTREFIMNGLDHVNVILGQPLLDRQDFEYFSRYQPQHGRHIAHYRAKRDLAMCYTDNDRQVPIRINRGELIHVEHSYKYNMLEIMSILNAAELDLVEEWMDQQQRYWLVLSECRSFHFEFDKAGTLAALSGSDAGEADKASVMDLPVGCTTCDEKDGPSTTDAMDQPLVNITGSQLWSETVPTLHEWEQMWTSWDVVTRIMLDHPTMLFERPISLRHPFIFYLGHIPAFLDIMMTRQKADEELGVKGFTEPAYFTELFERGIDPDMDDPSICNPHSEVPKNEKDWPSIDSMMDYQQRVRHRLRKLLMQWETDCYHGTHYLTSARQRAARVVWMCFEHEAMHLETLLYMLLQSPNLCPPPVAPPHWVLHQNDHALGAPILALDHAPLLPFSADAMTVTVGHNDDEALDGKTTEAVIAFGWDNEHPQREAPVAPFEIQTRPVTNGEYWAFLQKQPVQDQAGLWPASWSKREQGTLPKIKTSFGLADLHVTNHWPVQVAYTQAEAYAQSQDMRLPTEEEWTYLRKHVDQKRHDHSTRVSSSPTLPCNVPNVGFLSWTPLPVSNEQLHAVGDVWEWTSTIMESVPGYKRSELYPGYSADFFDGKHRVVLGGSWATHPRIAERASFKNWYQSSYPYVFSGFRLCRSLKKE
ncbi:hypothetical protein DM01DRAFT_1318138 [Hesseltinella vesiculosa]|uniref:Uncharacterized protein n=1 Tax=Hesseltinella vesiculosa TaxID=101127 RepID=A0A1X2GPQ3_9FUNG|nr:hypothetical protein DM01DRAFT_1318138 [Hesseltinella vesiculosa]